MAFASVKSAPASNSETVEDSQLPETVSLNGSAADSRPEVTADVSTDASVGASTNAIVDDSANTTTDLIADASTTPSQQPQPQEDSSTDSTPSSTSTVVATAASSRPSRSSAREAKRLFPGSEMRKLIRIQTQVERNMERQYTGKVISRAIDLNHEGDRMYNLNQEKLLRSVDITLLESAAAMLPPKLFGSPSSTDWLINQRPPKVFPLSLLRVFPPSRVNVEGFKTLLRLRAQLRDRACMLWSPIKPKPAPNVTDVGHLRRGAVNEFRKDNFVKVMRRIKKDGGELCRGATDSVFSGYGSSGKGEPSSRKRKRDGFDDAHHDDSFVCSDDSDNEDENDESMDKEAFIEKRLERYHSEAEKKAKRAEASKEDARAEKRQKKIEIGILTAVPMAGGVAENNAPADSRNVAGSSGTPSSALAVAKTTSNGVVGDAGMQTVEIRTKGIGYHQTVQVDEVVEVAKALQRNDKIEDVVALNRSAKNLSVKEMLALKRGKVT